MQVYLKAIGCRLNEAELESWASGFRRAGHGLTGDPLRADLMVFNSCAVTREAERKSRQLVRRLHRENRNAKLVMTGCYATLSPELAAERLGVDLVIDNARKDALVNLVEQELQLPTLSVAATEPAETPLFSRGRQRAFVKIQDGCRYRCTYCVVTVARGDERSRAVTDVIAEIDGLCAQGIREVVLTGVHVGGYGVELGSSLRELVASILERTAIERLRLASVEPWDLPADFFELFENPRLMPHMHLPMQSGSDSVLRRMARRCRSGEFRQLATQIRDQVPDFNITTDIIVGFPGESADEWRQTLDFVEELAFGHVHVFSFSPRQGTKAASLPDPVPVHTRKQRSRELHELAAGLRSATLERYLGRRMPVLWERHSNTGTGGYTPNMLRVVAETDGQELVNSITETTLVSLSADGGSLVGRPERL